MNAKQVQTGEHQRLVLFVLGRLCAEAAREADPDSVPPWPHEFIETKGAAWVSRIVDEFHTAQDLAAAEAELVPLERTLHTMTVIPGSSPLHSGMLDRVRTALKYLQGND